MSLLNIFKIKKEVEKPKEIKKSPKLRVEKKPEKKSRDVKPITDVDAYRILKPPHITEKASALIEKNQYVFKIWPRANKISIKKAIESLYKVDVLGVRTIKIPRKKRRLGKTQGFRKGYKKAIIRIKQGQKIEVLPR